MDVSVLFGLLEAMFVKMSFFFSIQCRPWPDAAVCDVWSMCTLFSNVFDGTATYYQAPTLFKINPDTFQVK